MKWQILPCARCANRTSTLGGTLFGHGHRPVTSDFFRGRPTHHDSRLLGRALTHEDQAPLDGCQARVGQGPFGRLPEHPAIVQQCPNVVQDLAGLPAVDGNVRHLTVAKLDEGPPCHHCISSHGRAN